MPYYRVVILVKGRNKPYSGIRFYESANINAIQQMCESKAREKFSSNLISVEAQMLSKLTNAVKQFIK